MQVSEVHHTLQRALDVNNDKILADGLATTPSTHLSLLCKFIANGYFVNTGAVKLKGIIATPVA